MQCKHDTSQVSVFHTPNVSVNLSVPAWLYLYECRHSVAHVYVCLRLIFHLCLISTKSFTLQVKVNRRLLIKRFSLGNDLSESVLSSIIDIVNGCTILLPAFNVCNLSVSCVRCESILNDISP